MIVRRWLLRRPTFILLGLALARRRPRPRRGKGRRGRRPAAQQASEERLRKDVFYLASDELEGRGPTTQGLAKSGRLRRRPVQEGRPQTRRRRWDLVPAVPVPRQRPRRAGPPHAQGTKGTGNRAETGHSVQPAGPQPLRQADRPRRLRRLRRHQRRGQVRRLRRHRRGGQGRRGPARRAALRRRANGRPGSKASRSLTRKIANAEKHKAAAVLFVNDAESRQGRRRPARLRLQLRAGRQPALRGDRARPASPPLRPADHAHGQRGRRPGRPRTRHRPRRQAAQPRPDRLDGRRGSQVPRRQRDPQERDRRAGRCGAAGQRDGRGRRPPRPPRLRRRRRQPARRRQEAGDPPRRRRQRLGQRPPSWSWPAASPPCRIARGGGSSS